MMKWLETFLREKEIQYTVYDIQIDNEIHIIDIDAIITLISQATRLEQILIQQTLIEIDYFNGDIHHYFKHLAKAYILNTRQLH